MQTLKNKINELFIIALKNSSLKSDTLSMTDMQFK